MDSGPHEAHELFDRRERARRYSGAACKWEENWDPLEPGKWKRKIVIIQSNKSHSLHVQVPSINLVHWTHQLWKITHGPDYKVLILFNIKLKSTNPSP